MKNIEEENETYARLKARGTFQVVVEEIGDEAKYMLELWKWRNKFLIQVKDAKHKEENKPAPPAPPPIRLTDEQWILKRFRPVKTLVELERLGAEMKKKYPAMEEHRR